MAPLVRFDDRPKMDGNGASFLVPDDRGCRTGLPVTLGRLPRPDVAIGWFGDRSGDGCGVTST